MAYKKGQSGNLKGRPKGTTCFAYVKELQKQYDPSALELFYKKAIELGADGDLTGLIVIYKSTERHRNQSLPINLTGSLTEQIKMIQEAASEGILTPNEILTLMTAVEKEAKVLEVVELEKKVNMLWEEREAAKIVDTEHALCSAQMQ